MVAMMMIPISSSVTLPTNPPGAIPPAAMAAACPLHGEHTFAHMLPMYTLAAGSPELSTQQVVVLVVQRHPL